MSSWTLLEPYLCYGASHTWNNSPVNHHSPNPLRFKSSCKFPIIPAIIVPRFIKAMSNQNPLLERPFEAKVCLVFLLSLCGPLVLVNMWHGVKLDTFSSGLLGMQLQCTCAPCKQHETQPSASVGPESSSLTSPE